MKNIINNNNLLSEIRRIVKEELEKQLPDSKVNDLWKYMNSIAERVKILEEKIKCNKK